VLAHTNRDITVLPKAVGRITSVFLPNAHWDMLF
jgi:hypothetical protein